jgi:hypothetical protein
VQDHVHAVGRFRHRFGIARVDFDDLRAGRCAVGRCSAHETRNLPSGIAKRLGGRASEAARASEYQHASARPCAH